ncbi:MAG: hypothetical protein K2H09_02525 [Treponemataceae bacterium]|nr:hypothetical protein [Treponemataceae bacterium]
MKRIAFFMLCVGLLSARASYAQHVTAEFQANHLLSHDGGTSWLFHFNVEGLFGRAGTGISAGASFTKAVSTLDSASFDVNRVGVHAGYRNDWVHVEIGSSYFCSGGLRASIGNDYFNKGFKGFSGGIQSSIKIGDVSVSPFFHVAGIDFKKEGGSFYWFYGSPEVPFALSYGSAASYRNSTFIAGGANARIGIVSESGAQLFQTEPVCIFSAFFQRIGIAAGAHELELIPFAAYTFLKADVSGRLTSQNQQYFAFPYMYYAARGGVCVHAAAAGCYCRYTYGRFSASLGFLLGMVPWERGEIETDWKYKKNFMFDGSAASGLESVDVLHLKGLALLSVKASYRIVPLRGGLFVQFAKLFFVPIDFASRSPSHSASVGAASAESILEYLLSAMQVSVVYAL